MFITSLQYHKITITILADCINALASVIKVLTIRITIMKKKNRVTSKSVWIRHRSSLV